MKFCDMLCKYAEAAEPNTDGSGSCRTFIGIYCKKKEQIIFKNLPCEVKKRREK
jgi:hypothetical protein